MNAIDPIKQAMETDLVDDVHEDRLFDVWGKAPGAIDLYTASRHPDPTIQAFAEQLEESFEIIDLREAPVGMGFSWGRYGPRTEVRRFGYERIFAYKKPPRRGWVARIFGA